MTKFYAFYGSLRNGPGCYNFKRLSLDTAAEQIETTTIEGFKMFSLGAYPYIQESTEKPNTITVDVMKINDPQVEGYIDRMEIGAGYQRKTININGRECTIYVHTRGYHSSPEVVGGDWVAHINKENKAAELVV